MMDNYQIVIPTSGGKAGKGWNVTGTVQVRRNNCVCKQFRFTKTDFQSKLDALNKARQFIADKIQHEEESE